MHTFGASVPRDLRAHALGQCWIPGSRQRNTAGHGRSRPIVANTDRAVGHLQAGHTKSRHGTDIKVVDSSEHVDLFLERHLPDNRLDAVLDIAGNGRRRLRELLYAEQENNHSRATELSHGTQHAQ